jgi:beta-glucosidase/6-phospho-beta-glucosidase/beta-galactosidase
MGVHPPLTDTNRQDYLVRHIRAAGQAMELYGVKLGGYFAWTFMDNFEWQYSYTKKFGLVKVNFADGSLRRIPKQSAYWYNHTIAVRGRNIRREPPLSWFPSV